MKKLNVFSVGVRGNSAKTETKVRSKLIIESTEDRPEYIEIDLYQKVEPVIRIHFSNDDSWSGTMAELQKKLI